MLCFSHTYICDPPKVEEELVGKKDDSKEEPDDLEANKGKASPVSVTGVSKVLTQAFTLTFLAEWGDRSQVLSNYLPLSLSKVY